MKRSTKIVGTVVLSLGLVGAALAYGKHRFSDPELRAEYAMNYVSDVLSLDTSQEQSLGNLKDAMLTARSNLHQDFGPLHEELVRIVSADTFDQADVLATVEAKTQAVNAQAPEVVAALATFVDSLNADQKAEIVSFLEHKVSHRGWHHRH